MDKAIAILKWLGNYDAEEALAELTAHKAKIDALKEWCNDELDKYSEYQTDIECGLFQAYNNVFQKLEGPTNA